MLYGTVTPANGIVSQCSKNNKVLAVTNAAIPISIRIIWRQLNLIFSIITPPMIVPPAPAGSKTTPEIRRLL